jgi:hypothetical protein
VVNIDNFHRIFLDPEKLLEIYGDNFTKQTKNGQIAFYYYELEPVPVGTFSLEELREQETYQRFHTQVPNGPLRPDNRETFSPSHPRRGSRERQRNTQIFNENYETSLRRNENGPAPPSNPPPPPEAPDIPEAEVLPANFPRLTDDMEDGEIISLINSEGNLNQTQKQLWIFPISPPYLEGRLDNLTDTGDFEYVGIIGDQVDSRGRAIVQPGEQPRDPHFVTYSFNPLKKEAQVIESMGRSLGITRKTSEIFQQRGYTTTVTLDNIQIDNKTCGAFAAWNTIQLLKGGSRTKIPTQQFVQKAQELVNQRLGRVQAPQPTEEANSRQYRNILYGFISTQFDLTPEERLGFMVESTVQEMEEFIKEGGKWAEFLAYKRGFQNSRVSNRN